MEKGEIEKEERKKNWKRMFVMVSAFPVCTCLWIKPIEKYFHEVRFERCTGENFPLNEGLILETEDGNMFFSRFLKTELRCKTRTI